jgi:hypothetical protein
VRPDAAASLEEQVDRVPGVDGLERADVTVAGQPAALFSGTRTGQRTAELVTVVGGQSLTVIATWLDGVGPEVPVDTLRTLATGVAEQAVPALS